MIGVRGDWGQTGAGSQVSASRSRRHRGQPQSENGLHRKGCSKKSRERLGHQKRSKAE